MLVNVWPNGPHGDIDTTINLPADDLTVLCQAATFKGGACIWFGNYVRVQLTAEELQELKYKLQM